MPHILVKGEAQITTSRVENGLLVEDPQMFRLAVTGGHQVIHLPLSADWLICLATFCYFCFDTFKFYYILAAVSACTTPTTLGVKWLDHCFWMIYH